MNSSTKCPRAEYPRPQFERNEWINLNGTWTYKISMVPPHFWDKKSHPAENSSTGFDKTITVPFSPESSLSCAGEDGKGEKDIINAMHYHRAITIPDTWTGKKILLHFGAVFYHAQVFIDGILADFHDGGSSSFAVDITSLVKPGKMHNLVVQVSANLWTGTIPSGKQSSYLQSYGCFYTRVTGIWQTVWMEAVDSCALQSVVLLPDYDNRKLMITPRWYGLKAGQKVSVSVLNTKEQPIAALTSSCTDGIPLQLDVTDCEDWSPENPVLYTVKIVTEVKGTVIDEVDSYFGMRKIHIEGNKYFLNNKPLYLRLVLDQGYYPDGNWTAPSDAALKRDIQLSLKAGFNGARLHQKVFEERFYYWADKLGYLLWGESPSWGFDYCTEGIPARNFLAEWAEIVRRDVNHPSLITWTPLNETFRFTDPHAHRRLHRDAYTICKNIDPTRPVNDSSGYIHYITDVWTVHTYAQDPDELRKLLTLKNGKPWRNFPEHEVEYTGQPYVVDEYGGIKWDPKTQKSTELTKGQNLVSWGYGEAPRTEDEFYDRLKKLTDVLLSLKHVQGYCYTQLTDVEQEKNGIYYYNRTAKFDMDKIKAIFSAEPKS